jgi:uncharacterized protein YkwD
MRNITNAILGLSIRLRFAWIVILGISITGGLLSGFVTAEPTSQGEIEVVSTTSTTPDQSTTTEVVETILTSTSLTPEISLPLEIPAESAAMLAAVNEFRSDNGVGLLVWCSALASSALGHSVDMANRQFFDHVNPDGDDPFARMLAASYGENGGENIAVGYESVALVMEAWIDSPGHRANLLEPGFVDFGEGHITGDYMGSPAIYWTQNFGFSGDCEGQYAESIPSDSVAYIEELDPRFDTCREANANGYGPYVSGVNPEYDWYRDRDGDGINCERG